MDTLLEIENSLGAEVDHPGECLRDAVTVTGHGPSRKLLFASPHGILHFIKIEESYGERSATLMVKKNQDNPDYWDLTFNLKPILTFATNDLAMKAYTDAYQILTSAFVVGGEKDLDELTLAMSTRPQASPMSEAEKSPFLRIVMPMYVLLILGAFTMSMALRLASNLLPWGGGNEFHTMTQNNHDLVPSMPTFEVPPPIYEEGTKK